MRLEISRLLFPFLLLGAVAGSLQAAGAAPEPGNALGDDDRLLKKITLRRPDATLRSLLEEIGKATGTKLTPPRDLAEQKFTLFFRDRPAARVIAVLAEYLDRKWARKGDGYELFADRAAQQRESEHANLPQAALIKDLKEEMSLSRLASEEIERLYQVHRHPKRTTPLTKSERGPWLQRLNRLAALRGERYESPRSRLLRSLTDEQLARLRSEGVLRLSSLDGSLPASVFSAMVTEASQRRRDGPTGQPVGSFLISVCGQGTENYATGAPPGPALHVGYELSFVQNGRVVGVGGGTSVRGGETPLIRLSAPEAHPKLLRPLILPPLKRTTRFAGLSPAQRIHAVEMEQRWTDAPPLSLLLRTIHDIAELDICSDSFVRVRARVETARPPASLQDHLTQLVTPLRYAWTLQDECLQFRSGLYYLDRKRETPPKEVERLQAELEGRLDDQLGVLAEATLRLSADQLRGFADHWPWYLEQSKFWIPVPQDNPRTWSDYAGVLALYGALEPGAQARLKAGQPVPMPRAPEALRRLDVQIVERAARKTRPVASIQNLARAFLSAELRQNWYFTYEHTEADGRRSIGASSGPSAPRLDSEAGGGSLRILAPPLPVSMATLDLRIPSTPNPVHVAHGLFRFFRPVPRITPPRSPAPERPPPGRR